MSGGRAVGLSDATGALLYGAAPLSLPLVADRVLVVIGLYA